MGNPNASASITIGTLSRVTGIPISTIRTWERRYGFPVPIRTQGNQRKYEVTAIEHLKLINSALERGMRAGQVVPLPLAELTGLLTTVPEIEDEQQREISGWLRSTLNLDGAALENGFRIAASRLGLLSFCTNRAMPFITLIGNEWALGRLQVFHEHFASERLHDFLTSIWRPLSDQNRGPRLVLAALPGEPHFLGLQLVATIAALNGYQLIFLGPKTPLQDIEGCALQSQAKAVCISISATANLVKARAMIQELRQMMPENINIVLGGQGAPSDIENVIQINSLNDFAAWSGANI